jgi:hypothetical protein
MPPAFTMVGDLMQMANLDVAGAPAFNALGFRLTDDDAEAWTRRFNAFKSGHAASVAAGARTLAMAWKRTIFVNNPRLVLVGAISSRDSTLATDAPVRRLGEAIAAAKNWEWRPDLLKKAPHRSLHGIRTGGRDRDAEVQNKYAAGAVGGSPGVFLIVDDFCTRGATFGEIKRALLASNPGWSAWGTALAKTERSSFWSGDISNAHIPEHLSRTWDAS